MGMWGTPNKISQLFDNRSYRSAKSLFRNILLVSAYNGIFCEYLNAQLPCFLYFAI